VVKKFERINNLATMPFDVGYLLSNMRHLAMTCTYLMRLFLYNPNARYPLRFVCQ
jgi:hypothetical protein